jgi:hypothetical protein
MRFLRFLAYLCRHGMGFEDRPDIDMVAFIERGEGQA